MGKMILYTLWEAEEWKKLTISESPVTDLTI